MRVGLRRWRVIAACEVVRLAVNWPNSGPVATERIGGARPAPAIGGEARRPGGLAPLALFLYTPALILRGRAPRADRWIVVAYATGVVCRKARVTQHSVPSSGASKKAAVTAPPEPVQHEEQRLREYASGKQVVVALRDVKRVFEVGNERVEALRGVTLDVYSGEYCSIMGPSGSGKSTLFNMIGGLDKPTGGDVTIHGIRMGMLSRLAQSRLRNRLIGYIFQTYNLVPVMTALQNVALPMLLGGTDVDVANDKAKELLTDVGLEHRLDHRPDELSGGQQQRVAIARGFANDPDIILADEPTGNLDTKTGQEIIDRLAKMSRERGVTIISATHDHKMLAVSDRVVSISDGEIESIALGSELDIDVGTIE